MTLLTVKESSDTVGVYRTQNVTRNIQSKFQQIILVLIKLLYTENDADNTSIAYIPVQFSLFKFGNRLDCGLMKLSIVLLRTQFWRSWSRR